MHTGLGRLARSLTVLGILGGSSLIGDSATAQTTLVTEQISQNAPASELLESEPALTPLPEAPTVLPAEPILEPVEAPAMNEATQVMVTDIQVVGSSVFNDRDFELILSAYEGRSLGFEALQQVADEIIRLYVSAGYIRS